MFDGLPIKITINVIEDGDKRYVTNQKTIGKYSGKDEFKHYCNHPTQIDR
jgi:hypothetical protein